MDLTPTTNTQSGPTAAVQTGSEVGSKSLQREDFMMLLLTQLQHQDPLKPMDDQALMTHFTQLNSLEELQGIHQKIGSLTGEGSLTEASTLIGKSATVSAPDGEQISGLVSSVSQLGEEITLMIEGKAYALSSLIHVQAGEV